MSQLKNISGFPERLPEQQSVESRVIAAIANVYRLHGFTPMETPAVELLSTLYSKGDDKEIYGVKRAFCGSDEEAEIGLHFDLTVPFARYVAQHYGQLNFPFRRSCLQKAWRGERPQKGRTREFYQFDIDIVSRDELPIACDAEVVTVIAKAFRSLDVAPFVLRFNNRKLLYGYCRAIGIGEEQVAPVAVIIDKLDKIGEARVRGELSEKAGLSEQIITRLWEFCSKRATPTEVESVLACVRVDDAGFQAGYDEVTQLMKLLPPEVMPNVKLDLSLVRGLTYYTGLVCEVIFPDYPTWPSFGGGGRYEDLTSQYLNQRVPGVGASIGVTRLMEFMIAEKLLKPGPKCPTEVLVTVYSEEQRIRANEVAEELRANGVATETYYRSPKLGKQIDYAADKGMQYVLFIRPEDGKMEIKNLSTKAQSEVSDIAEWARGRVV